MKKSLLVLAVTAGLSTAANAWYLTPFYDFYDTDTKSNGQSVSSSVFGLEGGNELFTLGYKHKTIDFKNSKDLDALHNLYGYYHNASSLGSDLTLKYAVGASLSYEDELEDLTDSLSLLGQASLLYRLDGDYSIEGGMGLIYNQIRYYPYPVVQLAYRNAQDQGLSYIVGFPKNDITYRFNDYFALNGDFTYANSSFTKLKEHNVYSDDGYLVDKYASATVSAIVTPHQSFNIEAGFGYTFDHSYKFYDHDGDYSHKVKLDPGYKTFINVNAHF